MSVSYRTKTKAPGTLLAALEASLLAVTRHQPGVETQPAAI